MAGTLVPVRIVVACAYGDVGHTFTPNGVLRDWLVASGFAEIVKPGAGERPAKFTAKAARKVAEGAKRLFS